MSEVTKWFQHDGDRTAETDKMAEELATHAMRDAWPNVQDIELSWTRHYQPDVWLLFATGTVTEES